MVDWWHWRRPDGSLESTRVSEPWPTPAAERPPSYVVGVDLGKLQDFTAIAVLERHAPAANVQATYHARFLRRWPLRTPYTTIVSDVALLVARPPLGPRTDVVIDHTGVGVAVGEMFARAGLVAPLSLISIHGGDTVSQEMLQGVMRYSVPKRELVATVTILLQQDRLRIAPSLPEARALVDELGAFEVKLSPAGHDSYNARVGKHDDLVLAVAMAAWFGERQALRQVYAY